MLYSKKMSLSGKLMRPAIKAPKGIKAPKRKFKYKPKKS